MKTTTKPLAFMSYGDKEALIDALTKAGDQGFFAVAAACGIQNPMQAWDIFVSQRWLIRCLDCGTWVPATKMTRGMDICTGCA